MLVERAEQQPEGVRREADVGVHEEHGPAVRVVAGARSTPTPFRAGACGAPTTSGAGPGGSSERPGVASRSTSRAVTPSRPANPRSCSSAGPAGASPFRHTSTSSRDVAVRGVACQASHAAASVRPSAGSSVRQGTASVTTPSLMPAPSGTRGRPGRT